jgi:glycerate kinase
VTRRILIAPDSFKGSLAAAEVAAALAAGWRSVRPDDELVLLPLADGGEGTVAALHTVLAGSVRRTSQVTGPDGRPVAADWLLTEDGTAVLELAQSSGLPLLAEPDPEGAHTYGLGQVARHAIAAGADRLLIGLGGSASTDGGTGALRALGARFLDRQGGELALGGGPLARLHRIELDGLIPAPVGGSRLLVDVTAPLLGEFGAARAFAPQKGASADQIAGLEAALARLADLLGGNPAAPGAGAAGGTGYGLAAGWDSELAAGSATLIELTGLAAALPDCDLLITGEGRFDQTSLAGKLVGTLLERAAGVPVAIVAGSRQESLAVPGEWLSLTELAGSSQGALAEPQHWLAVAGRILAERRAG